ncbi:MAG: hypothetical protein HOQ07_06055, partial [Sinomonas sp.]|nr:hypothetical protein [Sinomonas sp.]
MAELLAEGHVRGPATPPIVEAVQDELLRLWDRAFVIEAEDRLPFELAVVEVVTNAVRHARPPGGQGQLDLEVEVLPDLLRARLF